MQVKVWFQNRRTKYKRDRLKDEEVQKANSESLAACNILRMLQHASPPSGQQSKQASSLPVVPSTSNKRTPPQQQAPISLPLMSQGCQSTRLSSSLLAKPNCQPVTHPSLGSPSCQTTSPQIPRSTLAPPTFHRTVPQVPVSPLSQGLVATSLSVPMFSQPGMAGLPHMPLTPMGIKMPLLHR